MKQHHNKTISDSRGLYYKNIFNLKNYRNKTSDNPIIFFVKLSSISLNVYNGAESWKVL